jgi:hypothetical protein
MNHISPRQNQSHASCLNHFCYPFYNLRYPEKTLFITVRHHTTLKDHRNATIACILTYAPLCQLSILVCYNIHSKPVDTYTVSIRAHLFELYVVQEHTWQYLFNFGWIDLVPANLYPFSVPWNQTLFDEDTYQLLCERTVFTYHI